METIKRTKIVDVLKSEAFGTTVNVKGWVRTRRGSKQVNFIALNDGSTINNVQIVVDVDKLGDEFLKPITTGASISVNGILTQSQGKGQSVEIQATEIEIFGTADPATYPLQKKGHSMEFLREIAHLRPRTNTFGGIKILEEAVAKGHKFEFPVYWGVDLASEHERFLVEDHFKRPVILTDYPKEIKAFYMKQNEDGKTVRAMDVLFPKIGEIIGGSEREADYDKLMTRIDELGIPMKEMWWYLDTRRFGTVPHSGFGLGFERLLLFVTGMANIRDVIPFPRTPNNAEF